MSTATDDEQIPDPNEVHCPQCGAITPKGEITCRECGGSLVADAKKRVPPDKWWRYGVLAAVLAYFLLPLIFAPAAGYCGHRLRRYDESRGLKLVLAAFGSLIFWAALVLFVF